MKKVKINYNRKKIKKILVIFIAFFIGIFISIYLKSLNSENVYITLEEKRQLEDEIEDIRLEIIKLKEDKKKYSNTLNTYRDIIKNGDKSIYELMEEELIYLKEISGYSKVVGSGVTITIKDSERELLNGENPNDLLIHDIDILRILNDLKKAGAKGISINGERVLSSSQIKCSGATITVNQTTYGEPFIIKAVGDVDSLIASINSPQSYANLLREVYGIYINIEENEEITVNYYEKSK